MENLVNLIFSTEFGYSIFRVTTPILFAAMAVLISDKAGVVNIGLEGIMLMSALTGVIGSTLTGSLWVGLLSAILGGVLMAMFLAYFSLYLKADIILTGIVLNLMSSGLTVFILYLLTGQKGISSSLQSRVFPTIDIPFIKDIPIVGEILSGHNVLTYLAFLSVLVIYIFLYKTPLGLRIRAVGENIDAATSVGINVRGIQFLSLILSGILGGFGGAYMSMGYVSWFSRDMIAGRGFIALAAEAMGGGAALGTMLTSLLFGFADSLSNSLQSLRIPAEFVQMIPYLATIIGLVIYSSIRQKEKNRHF